MQKWQYRELWLCYNSLSHDLFDSYDYWFDLKQFFKAEKACLSDFKSYASYKAYTVSYRLQQICNKK